MIRRTALLLPLLLAACSTPTPSNAPQPAAPGAVAQAPQEALIEPSPLRAGQAVDPLTPAIRPSLLPQPAVSPIANASAPPLPLAAPQAPDVASAAAAPVEAATPAIAASAPLQPALVASGAPDPLQTPGFDVGANQWSRADLLGLFQGGVTEGRAGAYQVPIFQRWLQNLSDAQVQSVLDLMDQCQDDTESFFVLKALVAGESWSNVTEYASEIRGQDPTLVARLSTMREAHDLAQQWQDACGPAIVETEAGQVDPRYAWTIKHNFAYTVADPTGQNQVLAAQQKQWLEAYGGIAVPMGQTGGKGIAIDQLINDKLGPMLHVSYQFQAIADVSTALDAMTPYFQEGYDVPIRVTFSKPGEPEYGHFMLAMGLRGTAPGRDLLVHDPYTGDTNWISEQSLAQNDFSPIFNVYVRWTHYYSITPQ